MSALDASEITDAKPLQLNLLLLPDEILLATRFGEKGSTLKPLLHALSPCPLAKTQYDVLAGLLDEEVETLKSWITCDGMLDAYKLRDYLFPDVATMSAVLAEKIAK